ncbi:hypothetical protein [Microvirga vignae]|uniref:hypothetical protein n=1 Tax=Microvirga vignae TaxID=1225564 RepID=UPI0012371259|nr:hypothetical protein [Microvirga vignae]
MKKLSQNDRRIRNRHLKIHAGASKHQDLLQTAEITLHSSVESLFYIKWGEIVTTMNQCSISKGTYLPEVQLTLWQKSYSYLEAPLPMPEQATPHMAGKMEHLSDLMRILKRQAFPPSLRATV